MSAVFGREALLVSVLREPQRMQTLPFDHWEDLISEGLTAALLGIMARESRALGLDGLPEAVRRQFQGVNNVAEYNRRLLSWEANRIDLALRDVDCPVILLKGAAYHARGLPSLRGRLASDVDILVPKERIGDVENALKLAGWSASEYSDYDQHYYREWMHEIPPLQNDDRGSYVDVHHTILPETGRLKPDTERLFANARPIDGSRLLTLSDADLTLHTIVHCFQDGDLNARLRDLVDIDGLLRDFGQRPEFWDELFEASDAHGFGRPLFYALHFASDLLATPVPDAVMARAKKHAPSWPVMALMRFAVPRALMPPTLTGLPAHVDWAKTMMLTRSHWLKMPPWMLTKHLTRKAFLSLITRG